MEANRSAWTRMDRSRQLHRLQTKNHAMAAIDFNDLKLYVIIIWSRSGGYSRLVLSVQFM
jgi:hypothetical protein